VGVRAERNGGYAEYVTVAATAAAPIPRNVDPVDAGALGLASVTAFEGLRRLEPVQDRRIVVTGATGGVGSAAIGVARAMGARVTAVVRCPEAADRIRALGAHEVIATSEDRLEARLGTETVDGVLDTVAADEFGPCVAALRPGGRLVLVGAAGGGQVSFDAWHLLLGVTLTGYSSEDMDGAALRRAMSAITGWLQRETLIPPAPTLLSLHQAAVAHARLERRSVDGRVLLIPGQG
jgi:NADPH:quinone reductase